MVKFTKDCKIITIGHLPGHTKGKVDLLNAHGFTDVSAILCEVTPPEEVEATLRACPNSFFLVGGEGTH